MTIEAFATATAETALRALVTAKAGWFRQFTVRENGKVVGFSGVYITRWSHTQAMIAGE